MSEFLVVLVAVLPVFAIAGAGIFMRRVNWLTEEADESMLKVTVNLLAPCLIFDSILQNDALRDVNNLLLPPLIGFGAVALGIGVGLLGGRLAGLADRKAICTFAMCVGLFNYGYVPVPLAKLLFDTETVGVLFVHNVGVETAIWTLVLMLLSGSGKEWTRMFNAPLLAIAIAVPLNFFGGSDLVPGFLRVAIHMLGQSAIPVGLILVGATMADHLRGFHAAPRWRVMAVSCLLQMGVVPLLFLLIARVIPGSVELKRVMILQAAMPSAVFCIVMAKHFGGDAATALRAVLATSALSLVTIPLWIRFGMRFVGL